MGGFVGFFWPGGGGGGGGLIEAMGEGTLLNYN
jgi:hypothetical protein